jgi:ribosomal protein S18 acetylase RimI-like enzyme
VAAVTSAPSTATGVSWLTEFVDTDLDELCTTTEEAILEGEGFNWLTPPPRRTLESYWRGVLLVPERELVVARLRGHIVGSAQFHRPAPNNEAHNFVARVSDLFVMPEARGHGLARGILRTVETRARQDGYAVIEAEMRETRAAAISLFEGAGYRCWARKEKYARIGGVYVPGRYFIKDLEEETA